MTSAEYSRLMDWVSRSFNTIDAKGAGDEEAWRTIIYVLNHEDETFRHNAVPLLLRLVELRPVYKSTAVALLEERAVRSRRSDVLGRFLWLNELTQLIGIEADADRARMTRRIISMDRRLEKAGFVDKETAKFTEHALADKRSSAQMSVLLILFRASTLHQKERAWALKLTEQQMRSTQEPERRIWKVAHEALRGQMEAH